MSATSSSCTRSGGTSASDTPRCVFFVLAAVRPEAAAHAHAVAASCWRWLSGCMYTVGEIFGRDIWGYKREWGTDVFDMVRWSGWTDVSQLQCDPRRVKPWYFFIGGSPVELAPVALCSQPNRRRTLLSAGKTAVFPHLLIAPMPTRLSTYGADRGITRGSTSAVVGGWMQHPPHVFTVCSQCVHCVRLQTNTQHRVHRMVHVQQTRSRVDSMAT